MTVPYDVPQAPPANDLAGLLEAVLLFHGGGEWDTDKRLAWFNRVGAAEATTKVLCDRIRAALLHAYRTGEMDRNYKVG
jgi:hypothetical protein